MTAVTNAPIVRLRRLRLETVVGGTRLYTTTYGLAALAGAPASIARVPQAAWLAASSGTMLIIHTALAGGLAFGVLVLAGLSWMDDAACLAGGYGVGRTLRVDGSAVAATGVRRW